MTLRRKLGGPERAWGISAKLGSANTLRVARLRGPLTHELLESAFAWLSAKHPLLRVRVEERAGELSFTSEGVGPVPVAWTRVDDVDGLRALGEAELNASIDWTRGPLVRITGVEHAGHPHHYWVLVVFHHAINDSTSSTRLVSQLLALLARLAAGETPEPPETLPLLAPSDRLLPDTFRGVEGAARVARFLGRSVATELLLRPVLLSFDRRAAHAEEQRRTPRAGVPASGRTTHLLFRTLSPGTTKAIEEAARAHGTTVQGALCAAMLQAGFRMAHVHIPAVNYRLFSFVNMRGMLEPPVHQESLGCYVSMVGCVHRVGPDTDFWELARSSKHELDDAIARGDALANVAIADRFVDFVSRRGRHTLAAMTVSNIGRLPFAREHGAFSLLDLHAASAMNGIGACCAAIVSTLHGSLSWTFTYVKPFFDEAAATRYFDLAVDILCESSGVEAVDHVEVVPPLGDSARVGARSAPGIPPPVGPEEPRVRIPRVRRKAESTPRGSR